jgi:hypothetical protein
LLFEEVFDGDLTTKLTTTSTEWTQFVGDGDDWHFLQICALRP